MDFDRFFKFASYSTAFCGMLTLTASGGIGILITTLFLAVLVLAWFLEDTKWQISERAGVVLVLLVIPLFYLDWKYQFSGFSSREAVAAGNLARLILILAAIKLLQKKANRDWSFLYLISFFEVLLAAGIGISPLFLAALFLYLLFAVCSVVAFEIKRSSQSVFQKTTANGSLKINDLANSSKATAFRLPLTATGLLLLITFIAVPLFFALPRVGGTGFGQSLNGLTGFTGFSDSVKLGEIGKLQQNDEVVMRVRLEEGDREKIKNFRWRGVALDTFENNTWRRSRNQFAEPFIRNERDYFIVDRATNTERVVTQTVYLEPIDTPVLFALSRPVALQGNFHILTKDAEGSITIPNFGSERTSYKVFSDTALPDVTSLRADNARYSIQWQRYLRLPAEFDERISDLARNIILESSATNRYDQAKAIEKYLQTKFGYTLEMKAGGRDPLADFLFNVREGHCEYFATAMAVMLRSQGFATRVVNGFQQGEYNETAGVYVVRQKDAHSWVEVYFPKENAWVPFDPTPPAGQFPEETTANMVGQFNKLLEALETFWIQYVVSYDTQEQRSLMRSMRNNFSEYQTQSSVWLSEIQAKLTEWWKDARGDKGFQASAKAVGFAIGYILAIVLGIILAIRLFRQISKYKLLEKFRAWLKNKNETSIVEFYERMQKVLAKQGLQRPPHQTPLEFAFALNMPEAVKITEKYNSVRFGEKSLTKDETAEIENWLFNLENKSINESKTYE
jgi:protein-glutamine gamma-glutamyltransferase